MSCALTAPPIQIYRAIQWRDAIAPRDYLCVRCLRMIPDSEVWSRPIASILLTPFSPESSKLRHPGVRLPPSYRRVYGSRLVLCASCTQEQALLGLRLDTHLCGYCGSVSLLANPSSHTSPCCVHPRRATLWLWGAARDPDGFVIYRPTLFTLGLCPVCLRKLKQQGYLDGRRRSGLPADYWKSPGAVPRCLYDPYQIPLPEGLTCDSPAKIPREYFRPWVLVRRPSRARR